MGRSSIMCKYSPTAQVFSKVTKYLFECALFPETIGSRCLSL